MPDDMKPNPADLPETFTMADLEKAFDPEEIEAMKAADPDLLEVTSDNITIIDDEPDDPAADAVAAISAAKPQEAKQAEPETPLADIPDTSEAEAAIAQIKTDRATLRQKYDDGELTSTEMDEALDKLVDAQATAMAQIKAAESVIVANQQTREQQWMGALEAFKSSGNEVLFSDAHAAGFDKTLRAVTGDPDNANLPFQTMIQLAARQHAASYHARTGQAVEIKAATGKTVPGTEVKRTGPRPDPRPEAIETLSALNGDGEHMVQDGTFSAIDRLADRDPDAAISRMGKMSPDQLDAYLNAVPG